MTTVEQLIKEAMEARLEELRPLLDEYERLQGALLALKDIPVTASEPITADVITRSGNKARRKGPAGNTKYGKRYTKGEKEAAVTQARKTSVEESARTYGISTATINRWLKQDRWHKKADA
jgi:hypothetical protein